MILLDVGGLGSLITMIYVVCHIPAIIMLIFALAYANSKPDVSKKLFIGAAVYFLIGGGICGALLN